MYTTGFTALLRPLCNRKDAPAFTDNVRKRSDNLFFQQLDELTSGEKRVKYSLGFGEFAWLNVGDVEEKLSCMTTIVRFV